MKELIPKKILLFFSLIVLSILLIGCTGIIPPGPSTESGAPVITSSPLSTTAKVGQLYFYGVKATDPDGDSLTYSLMKNPAGMYINSESGLINWRPKFNQVGVHDVMIKVTDGEKSDTQSFKITVPGSLATSLKITSTPVTSVTVDELYTYQVETNYSGADPLIFSLTVSPTGMVIDADTGVITWTPDATLIGDHDVTVEVTDGDDVETQTFVVTVNDILTSIVVLPETMDLSTGQSKTITSIVASYANSADKSIALAAGSYQSSNSAVATAAAGVITGVSGGTATITVSYTEGANTQTDTVDVTVVKHTLELQPFTQSVSSGSPVSINVVVQDITDLKGASITLDFDASILQFDSCADGGFITNNFIPPQTIDNVGGSVVLDIAGLGATASGSGNIFVVTFNTVGTGNTDITFGTTQLRDSANNDIVHTIGDGCSVTVN